MLLGKVRPPCQAGSCLGTLPDAWTAPLLQPLHSQLSSWWQYLEGNTSSSAGGTEPGGPAPLHRLRDLLPGAPYEQAEWSLDPGKELASGVRPHQFQGCLCRRCDACPSMACISPGPQLSHVQNEGAGPDDFQRPVPNPWHFMNL